jgi:chromosome segregation protein
VRLRQIKLAGFKSFVDPTQIDFPGRLVGVVGPNGCGKSNVIDAVRWVLGESKAAELRGESMQDVIFNGAANRKPAGRASVELVFDNSEGRIAGEWGRFSELSVRRVLTRDNTSSYFINNQQVRRRDVHDLFLGTGLGPRAYAIIGQGMVSRIVESRPEELRIFLEEAAGVSRYKERRRETESRLSDARENLTRVEDVIRELEGQIERLQRQAEVARKHRELTAEHAQAQALLWMRQRAQGRAERDRHARDIEQAETAIEAQVSEVRAIELRLEQERGEQYAAGDAASAAHAGLARINTEVGRLEGEIRATLEARARLAAQRESLLQARERRREEIAQMHARVQAFEQGVAGTTGRLEVASAELAAHDAGLPALEQQVQALREALTVARTQAAAATQEIDGAAAQSRALERQGGALLARRERLEEEQRELGRPDAGALERLQGEVASLAAAAAQLESASQAAEARERELTAARQQLGAARDEASALTHRLEARLHALQETLARIEADERLDPWLRSQGLGSLPRLFQKLEVEPGWESAIEAVLRERVEALEVGRLETIAAFARSAPPSRVSFFSSLAPASEEKKPSEAPPGAKEGLVAKVRIRSGSDAGLANVLADWLAHVFVATDLDEAMRLRGELPAGAQFVVAGGHLVSRHAVRFFAADDRKAGLLAKQREAEEVQKELHVQRTALENSVAALAQVESQLHEATQNVREGREKASALRARHHARQIESVRLSEMIERIRHRGGQIEQELAEVEAEQAEVERQRRGGEERFTRLDQALAQRQESVEAARVAEEGAEAGLRAHRERSRLLESARQALAFEIQSARERIHDLEHAQGVGRSDIERIGTQVEAAELDFARLDDSAARGGLDALLAERVAAETLVNEARSRADEWMARARASEEQKTRLEKTLQPRRDKVTDLRLREQAARIAVEQCEAQLAQVHADLEALEPQLAGAGSAGQLSAQIEQLAAAILELGAVNQAALEELEAAQTRQGYLASQSADLRAAVSTLEDAIRRIDLETRTLLLETFEAVNRHFGELFPRLFGGGEARLSMTGEEILDAGVLVTAQPPGKRNTSIHLLSGGEKALTATALVFALFKLNPAPFCLLDEVDAPLDDENTERFCDLVRSMTDATQFLFITHNKLAMELAEQLVGVTMQEQGVSRIVAVDMDDAVRLAEAA